MSKSKPSVSNGPKISNVATSPKKKYIGYLLISCIVIPLLAAVFYSILNYPKSEDELNNKICGRYWKPIEYTVDKIYVNDTLVPKPGTSDVRESVRSVFNDKSSLYPQFLEIINATRFKDDFFALYCNPQKKYFWFELSYNSDRDQYTYSFFHPSLNKINGNFIFGMYTGIEQSYVFETDEMVPEDNSYTISKYEQTVKKISSDELVIENDMSAVYRDSNQRIRIIFSSTYQPVNPQSKYVEKINVLKKKWEETPAL